MSDDPALDPIFDEDPRVRFGYDMFFDRNGVPITLRQFCQLMDWNGTQAYLDYRRIGFDEIGLYQVSTVWLGVNHNFSIAPDAPPLIFETMVFLAGTAEETYMHRYSTEQQALAGHEAVCAEIRATEQLVTEQHPMREGSNDHDR